MNSRPRFSFILRIWFERGSPPEAALLSLRGALQQTGLDKVHYFHTLRDLPPLLWRLTGWQETARPDKDAQDDDAC